MPDTYKFPGGRDVTVVRKQDVVECINNNIVDKEVALAIVQQCEIDAVAFLRQGRWTGIPFIGNIRANQVRKLEHTKEQRELIDAAYNTVSTEQYVLFRRNLAHDNYKRLKANKYYNYILASAISKNKDLFRNMCKEYGEAFTRIHFLFKPTVVSSNTEIEYIRYGEVSND